MLRLDILALTALVTGSEPWVVIAPATIEALGICLVAVAWGRPSSPRLVRWALELNRLAALMFFWSLAIIFNHVGGAQEPLSPIAVGFGGLVTVEAGLASVEPDAALAQELAARGHERRGLSRTGKALVGWLTRLTCPPSEGDDAELSRQVGTTTLAPLHFGALYCLLGLSIGQVAALVGRSKSVVYRGLVALEGALSELDPFPAAANFSGVLGIDEKWVKIPKSFSDKERGEGKKWRYAFFAVDALTGDLLHLELYDRVDSDTVRAFLVTLRAMGIRPRAVVTDMLAAYDQAIEEAFGKRVVHHFCLFHHLQAVRARLRERCGSGWKQEPMLCKLVKDIDAIYACKSRKTAKKRLAAVLAQRGPRASEIIAASRIFGNSARARRSDRGYRR